jgi:hypothetical protein
MVPFRNCSSLRFLSRRPAEGALAAVSWTAARPCRSRSPQQHEHVSVLAARQMTGLVQLTAASGAEHRIEDGTGAGGRQGHLPRQRKDQQSALPMPSSWQCHASTSRFVVHGPIVKTGFAPQGGGHTAAIGSADGAWGGQSRGQGDVC